MSLPSSLYPKHDFELDIRTDFPEEQQAQTAAERLAAIHDVARSEMRYAQLRYQDYADNHRSPAPAFQPGDLVSIDGRHCRMERPSRKLENKHHGPYRVTCLVGSHAYELDIPDTVRKHRVFPVSLLHCHGSRSGHVFCSLAGISLLGFLCWNLRRVREAGRARTRLGFGCVREAGKAHGRALDSGSSA